MQGVRGDTKLPGEFRQSQNWIGMSLQHAIFIPPHCNDLPHLMSDLEQFIHNEDCHVPHLIKIALLHYQFETIHPFLDGNGRLGRLMIALYFANFNLLLNVKTNTASALIKDPVKLKILEEMTGKQRNRLFVFKPYLMIFNREHS